MRSDANGLVLRPEVKLYGNGVHTWKMKLSQLARQGQARIVTYSLPHVSYISDVFKRRPHGILMVCHEKFADKARAIHEAFPLIDIRTHRRVHAKICLIEPKTVFLGSANFGQSKWHEAMIGIKSKKAHDFYLENTFYPLWDTASLLEPLDL